MNHESDQPDPESRQVEAFEPLPGELLLAARRARGISPEKVAESLNLDLTVIHALEDNRFDDLGAPVFARGHLRKYARLLGLDPNDVLKAYDAVATEQSSAALTSAPSVAEAGPPPSRSWLRPLVFLLAISAAAILVWRILSNGGPATVDDRPPPAAVGEEEDAGSEPRAILPPPPSPTLDAEPAQPGAGSPVGAADETSRVPPARESVTVGRPPAEREPPLPAASGDRVRVVFTFGADSWLEVRDADGRRLAYEMGRGGRTRAVSGRPPLSVSLGQVQGVAITVDGRPFEVPATAIRGNTARFSVDAPKATTD